MKTSRVSVFNNATGARKIQTHNVSYIKKTETHKFLAGAQNCRKTFENKTDVCPTESKFLKQTEQ